MFVVALLQPGDSPVIKSERKLLKKIIQCIQDDEILKQWIHLVCVDNHFAKSLLANNTSGVSVHHLPSFAIRSSTEEDESSFENSCPKIYDLYKVNKVFSKVYQAHYYLLQKQGKKYKKCHPPTISF